MITSIFMKALYTEENLFVAFQLKRFVTYAEAHV